MARLMLGDCLERMKEIESLSVDLVLTDPPYGTTACKWDSVIPIEPMWEQVLRIAKHNAAIVITSTQPFTTTLISSQLKHFKYCWYWKKKKPNGFQHAKNRPMMIIEDVVVFSKSSMGHISKLGDKRMNYNPQGIIANGLKMITDKNYGRTMGARPNQIGIIYESFTNFPHNCLEYSNIWGKSAIHPTQKPVELMEYLIKTYTNEGDTVLDFAMGSGTTGVACKNLNRQFIGIELDPKYFAIAKQRMGISSVRVKVKRHV